MARKYLKGGALNPIWCDEQDREIATRSIMDGITDLLNVIDMDLNLQFREGIGLSISNKNKGKEMCIIDTESDYEAKFNFLKNHSGTPEDLQLAKDIIGLK